MEKIVFGWNMSVAISPDSWALSERCDLRSPLAHPVPSQISWIFCRAYKIKWIAHIFSKRQSHSKCIYQNRWKCMFLFVQVDTFSSRAYSGLRTPPSTTQISYHNPMHKTNPSHTAVMCQNTRGNGKLPANRREQAPTSDILMRSKLDLTACFP